MSKFVHVKLIINKKDNINGGGRSTLEDEHEKKLHKILVEMRETVVGIFCESIKGSSQRIYLFSYFGINEIKYFTFPYFP